MSVLDVHVTYNGGKFVCVPDPAPISKSHGQTIKWHNDYTEKITISFGTTSPFPQHLNPYSVDTGKTSNSGSIIAEANTSWKYSISSPNGGVTDPQVDVNP